MTYIPTCIEGTGGFIGDGCCMEGFGNRKGEGYGGIACRHSH